jgi:hypothetical protein
VIACVGKAVVAGFLSKERALRPDGSQSTNRYSARYPDLVSVQKDNPNVHLDVQRAPLPVADFQKPDEGVVQPTTPGVVQAEGGGGAAHDTGVVQPTTPLITLESNSETLLTSPYAGSPVPAAEPGHAGEGAAGKQEPGVAEQAAAAYAEVRAALAGLPGPVKAIRAGREPAVSEKLRVQVREAHDRLKSLAAPAPIGEMAALVLNHRAGCVTRPDLDRLQADFHEHGWKIDLACFPNWAVDQAFSIHKAEHGARKPRSAEIGKRCRDVLVPVNAALAACERYLALPLPAPPEQQPQKSAEYERLASQAIALTVAGKTDEALRVWQQADEAQGRGP